MSDSCKVDACKPQACAIQDCLKQYNYNESKCTKVIDQLYACCTQFYADKGLEARSPCCPIPRLLDMKIQQRQQERVDAQLVHHRR